MTTLSKHQQEIRNEKLAKPQLWLKDAFSTIFISPNASWEYLELHENVTRFEKSINWSTLGPSRVAR